MMMVVMEVEMMTVMGTGEKENTVMVTNVLVGTVIGMMNTEVEEVLMVTVMAEEVEALTETENGLMQMKDHILRGMCILSILCICSNDRVKRCGNWMG